MLVQLGAPRALDRDVLLLARSVSGPQLDAVASVITIFGQPEVTAGIAAGLAAARLRARRGDFWVPLAIAITVILEATGKILITQPGPPRELQRDLGLVEGITIALMNGFPSGHVARDTFLLLIVHGWPRLAVGLALALVALSRIYPGAHWPSDVLGGLLLGAAVAWGALALTRRPREA